MAIEGQSLALETVSMSFPVCYFVPSSKDPPRKRESRVPAREGSF